MPIIDFDFYVDAASIRAAIIANADIIGYETIDGLNASYGEIRANIAATSALYGNINVDGTSYVGAGVLGAGTFTGTANVTLGLLADINSVSSVVAYISYSEGRGYLPILSSYGGEYEVTSGAAYLPSVYSEAHSWYVPGRLTEGFGVLLGFTSVGYIADPNIGEAYLPRLVNAGWLRTSTDDEYTVENMVGAANLPIMHGFGYEGERLEVTMSSSLFGFSASDAQLDLIVVFNSSMTIADTYTVQRSLLAEYIDTLTATSTAEGLGAYQLSMLDAVGLTTTFTATVGALPGTFSENSTVWVLNIDNNGSTQYDNFAFNSFAKRDTDYLGAAEDGIYLLSGDTDAGEDISAEIALALSNFSTPQAKYFPVVYLGATSTGRLLLKANVDGTDWFFEANNTSSTMANQRIDLGKGLRGSHWRFTILNQDGLDFDLESVEFLPLISSRRAY